MAAMSGKKYQEENNGWYKKWVNQRVPPIYTAWRSKIPVVCYADPSCHGAFKFKPSSADPDILIQGLRTPNEGINQRYLKNWADAAYLKIWEWAWIYGRAVKAISSLGVRSPCFRAYLNSNHFKCLISMDLVTRSLIQFIFVSHCVKKTNPLFMTEKPKIRKQPSFTTHVIQQKRRWDFCCTMGKKREFVHDI